MINLTNEHYRVLRDCLPNFKKWLNDRSIDIEYLENFDIIIKSYVIRAYFREYISKENLTYKQASVLERLAQKTKCIPTDKYWRGKNYHKSDGSYDDLGFDCDQKKE